jgi:hypothetical protein
MERNNPENKKEKLNDLKKKFDNDLSSLFDDQFFLEINPESKEETEKIKLELVRK